MLYIVMEYEMLTLFGIALLAALPLALFIQGYKKAKSKASYIGIVTLITLAIVSQIV